MSVPSSPTVSSSAGVPGDDVLTPRDNIVGETAGGTCHLANLFLHSVADADGSAQPIDVAPVPNVARTYSAVMDYSMTGFEIEATAVPRGYCEVSSMTTSAINVDPGSFVETQFYVEPISGTLAPQSYTLNVSRLTGTETSLHSLGVRGAYLVPAFSSSVQRYTVNLNLDEDFVRVDFQKLDNGQSVVLKAGMEAASVGSASARRLALNADGSSDNEADALGEVQREKSTLMTTLDVGHERLVALNVNSADMSVTNSYYLSVKRPPCPKERRFFDGKAKICTDICNEGYFGNPATGRCTSCLDPKCAVCEPGTTPPCSLCFDGYELRAETCVLTSAGSTAAELREVQDGLVGYQQTHETLVYGGGAAVLVAICACCFFVWCQQGGGIFRRRKPLLGGDEDDDEMSNFGYYEESSARG
eukprot:TRINITY_DN97878_c0_g1_i1.p1 TRINITY_DN97878_c0_g1~~TRINITY_DN97878_c0_g1_i1.p1  ORF type:complete len:427 (-),score=76.20 TRINITY_DN97878_c0_g1_i1:59-1309(-)